MTKKFQSQAPGMNYFTIYSFCSFTLKSPRNLNVYHPIVGRAHSTAQCMMADAFKTSEVSDKNMFHDFENSKELS